MTNDDLGKIEETLGVQLQAEYRRAVTSPDPAHLEYYWIGLLYNQPDVVIKETRRLAEITKSFDDPWDEKWVVVSVANDADGILLDTSKPEAVLLLWDHETNLVKPFGMTVTELANIVNEWNFSVKRQGRGKTM